MATEAAVIKRNLESSILFMQQEHAETLKALHEEIHKLQKRCTDLTFQLTMHGINVEEEGDVDSRLQEVHSQLQVSQSKESSLETRLQQQDRRLAELEQELRLSKKRQLDEMRLSAQNISGLRAEVEAKSNNIAFLTTELHRLKVKQKMEMPGGGLGPDPSIVRRAHLPAPPRDTLTNSARARQRGHTVASPNVRRLVGGTGGGGGAGAGINVEVGGPPSELVSRSLRVASASAAMARSSGSESPDISPFMHQRELDLMGGMMGVGLVEVKKPAPLPPIAVGGGGLGERGVHKVILSKHAGGGSSQRGGAGRQGAGLHRGLAAHHHHRLTDPPEVPTLAVDQVSDANWKRPSESHSSEYN